MPKKSGGGVLTSNRYHGVLGSYSLVQISDELMMTAVEWGKENGVHFDYYCLLSGQDYLIQSVRSINTQLLQNYPKPYIDCTPCYRGNWVYNGSRDCGWYKEVARKLSKVMPHTSWRRKIIKAPLLLANIVLRDFMNPQKRLEKSGVKLFGGSAWWILPDDMVAYLIEERAKFGKKSRFFPLTYVGVPEENYYQTILMNSSFNQRIEVNPPDMVAQNCKTYANFTPVGKKFIGHPYILKTEDKSLLEKLAENKFFARKFDIQVDSKILDWIDRNLLSLME